MPHYGVFLVGVVLGTVLAAAAGLDFFETKSELKSELARTTEAQEMTSERLRVVLKDRDELVDKVRRKGWLARELEGRLRTSNRSLTAMEEGKRGLLVDLAAAQERIVELGHIERELEASRSQTADLRRQAENAGELTQQLQEARSELSKLEGQLAERYDEGIRYGLQFADSNTIREFLLDDRDGTLEGKREFLTRLLRHRPEALLSIGTSPSTRRAARSTYATSSDQPNKLPQADLESDLARPVPSSSRDGEGRIGSGTAKSHEAHLD